MGELGAAERCQVQTGLSLRTSEATTAYQWELEGSVGAWTLLIESGGEPCGDSFLFECL